MKARRGHVALYIIAIFAALAVLMVMNVDVFLAVRTKNRATNAGDAAALAVARHQGELLNAIGEDNLEHVRAAVAGDVEKCDEIMTRQARKCFLDPLEGIRIGNDAARENGIDRPAGGGMLNILRRHVSDIRTVFEQSPELYPEPWEGAWEEYATRLETMLGTLGEGLLVGPDNCEFVDAWSSYPLLSKQFYNAVAGRNWCWFHFNGEGLLDCDSSAMPRPSYGSAQANCNCEIYSLHLAFSPMPAFTPEWCETLSRLADVTIDPAHVPSLLKDPSQKWAFFDYRWNAWSTYPGIEFNPDSFPISGEVRPEYDVLGCAAICRVRSEIPAVDVLAGEGRLSDWTAAAKPFGTVSDANGAVSRVTAFNRFVTPCFSDVRLVPIDAVGGRELATADPDWMTHVKDHLPDYFANGPRFNDGCWYCVQLVTWEPASFRQSGRIWLKYHSGECVVTGPGPGGTGGTAHGH